MSDSGWRPLRSDYLTSPKLGHHAASVLLAMLAMPLFGGILWLVGIAAIGPLPVVGRALESVGFLVVWSVLVSWVGHVPLAFALHRMMRRGQGGWLAVLFVACAIGAFWTHLLKLPLVMPVAITGGLIQGWILRRAVLSQVQVD